MNATDEGMLSQALKVEEVDAVEILSLVDNSVDYLSSIDKNEVQTFRQWMKERHKNEVATNQSQLPIAEHGFAMLIRVLIKGKLRTVLFDTGSSSDGAVTNAERMDLDLNEVDCIVLSHGHYDHFGGLLSVLKAINKVNLPLIIHEDMFKTRGTANQDETIRIYPKFPAKEQLSPAHLIGTKQPLLIADDMILVTGKIPRETTFERGYLSHRVLVNGSWQPDPCILDDRAVIVNVKGKGLVVISGCAHSGIINTITYAQQITGITTICAVLGGFHLAGRENENRIEPTVKELKRINPQLIAPSHCTGWRGMCAIANVMPNASVWNSVGNLYKF